jgi:hypothetical protein
MAITFSNPAGGVTALNPLNLMGGYYLVPLGNFSGATAGAATLAIGALNIPGTVSASGVFTPTTPTQLPNNTPGAATMVLTAGADTATVYINLISVTAVCGQTVLGYSAPAAERKNATLYPVNGAPQKVLIKFDSYTNNAAALAAGLLAGDVYLNSSNALTIVT